MATPIVQYYANVGIAVDNKSLTKVDKYLLAIENKLKRGIGKTDFVVNARLDETKFNKHLRGILARAGKANVLNISNFSINPSALVAGVKGALDKAKFIAPITGRLSRDSIRALRSQLQGAFYGIPVGVRLGSVASRSRVGQVNPSNALGMATAASIPGERGTESARRRASITGRGDPSMMEQWMGKPGRSSLSAGNRRYYDAVTNRAFGGVGGDSLMGLGVQGGLGGLARSGSSSVIGRMASSVGMAVAGPFGGAMALVAGGLVQGATTLFTGVWKTLGAVVTAPFKLIGGAASMVTSAFYRLALAAIPLVAGFNYINRRVQEGTQQQMAMNTVAKSLGSTGQEENRWLMNMANRDGMRYDTLAQPYTSFIASASPSMGLDMAKNVFESFTQFGATRGAGDVSMGLAMKAVAQIAGKGKIQAEELRGQLGDAPGFGEMQGIFAEAYQRSIGRTGDQILKGQKGIEELNKAMEKGQAISAKVLPYVAEIAKKMAAVGLEEARGTSFAEQNRAMNTGAEGWKAFRSGGGEEGVAFFWRMMQRMADWWASNGDSLGAAFNKAMLWMDAFRLGIYEAFQFAKNGESNSFVEWVSGFGINLHEVRKELVNILDQIGNIFGLGRGGEGDTLISRVQNFSIRLVNILSVVGEMLKSVSDFMDQYRIYRNAPMFSAEKARAGFNMIGQFGNVIGGTAQATGQAAGMLTDIVGATEPGRTDYRMYGNANQGFEGKTIYGGPNPDRVYDSRRSSYESGFKREVPKIDIPSFNLKDTANPLVIKNSAMSGKTPFSGNYANDPMNPTGYHNSWKPSVSVEDVKTLGNALLGSGVKAPMNPATVFKPEQQIPTFKPQEFGRIVPQTPLRQDSWNRPTPQDTLAPRPALQQQETKQNLNIKIEVNGNAEVIGALMDERARTQFPLLLASEITRQVVNAPKTQ